MPLKEQLLAALAKPGERAAMAFLAAHPEIVYWGFARTDGHASYVLKEFPFGSNYRSDFVVLHAYSGAWEVHFVELEPPKDKIITKKGVAKVSRQRALTKPSAKSAIGGSLLKPTRRWFRSILQIGA